jgi:hypothetical protein
MADAPPPSGSAAKDDSSKQKEVVVSGTVQAPSLPSVLALPWSHPAYKGVDRLLFTLHRSLIARRSRSIIVWLSSPTECVVLAESQFCTSWRRRRHKEH